MTISGAFRRAFGIYFGRIGAGLKFWLTELCLTLICLAPLLFLTDGGLAWGAALSAVLFILVLLPARVNAAAAMQDAVRGGSLFSLRLAETDGYGAKLRYGLKRVGLMLLWAAPLIACALIARGHISGDMDGFTLMRLVKNFGGGELIRGMIYLALILAAALLILAFGFAFHSGDRHACVLGDPKLIRGRRGKTVLCWLCGLIILLPLWISLAVLVSRYLPVLTDINGLLLGTVNLPSTRSSAILLGVGILLTVPLLPLRSLVTAAFVGGEAEKK